MHLQHLPGSGCLSPCLSRNLEITHGPVCLCEFFCLLFFLSSVFSTGGSSIFRAANWQGRRPRLMNEFVCRTAIDHTAGRLLVSQRDAQPCLQRFRSLALAVCGLPAEMVYRRAEHIFFHAVSRGESKTNLTRKVLDEVERDGCGRAMHESGG